VEHQQQPATTFVAHRGLRRTGDRENLAIHAHALGIVDVKHPPQRPEQISLLVWRARARDRSLGVSLELRPAVVLATVDVDGRAIRLRQKVVEAGPRQPPQVIYERAPLRQPCGVAQVPQHDLLALAV
jgi:hypothetical protein